MRPKHHGCTREHFEDMPEVRDWMWTPLLEIVLACSLCRMLIRVEFDPHAVAIRGCKSTTSNRQFESCDVVFARKSTNRTVKHSALA
jgi:hypothetical protein